MFKHNSVGRLGFFLSFVVLTSACAVGEIGNSAGEPRLDVGFSDAALTCPGVSADVSASDGWDSKEASQPAPDALYFEVMARPTEANLDALVAVGAQDIQDFSDAAITVRFSETGLVDVMDETEYSSDGSFEYDPGVWYNIAISANVTARTYDVEVGRCGEKRRSVIRGARFRTEANVYDRLSNWGVWSSQRAALELSTPTWMTSGTCAPATCQAMGAECGQPSDGCNGTLNCGVCGGGQSCSSGACVDEPVSVPPPPTCTPASCQYLGAECGAPSDGCGGTLNCGGCGAGQSCSNNVCVDPPVTPPPIPPACVPNSCQALGAECGVRSNGCGGTLNCGGCGAGQSCLSSLCIDNATPPPPPPACTPDTCQSLGTECGQRADGCGGILNCGGCGAGETCSIGVCVAPPPPVCTPASCQALSAECGLQSDGCGGLVNCGSCGGGETCSSSGRCAMSGSSNWWETTLKPNATNTGPNCTGRAGCPSATLLSGNAPPSTITQNGATYENFTLSGTLDIDANNVTLRNFSFNASGVGSGTVIENTGTNLVIEYAYINGGGGNCGQIFNSNGWTVRYSEFENCSDIVKISDEYGNLGPVLVEDSYWHNVGGGHGDTIQIWPGTSSDITFRHNHLEGGNTSIVIDWDVNAPARLLFEENWLQAGGAGYSIYCSNAGGGDRIYRDNLFDRGFIWGAVTDSGCTQWSGNLYMDNLAVVPY